jgi:short-subunit dehydrogenase involved in D-alanine esterification of teichoic acids
MNQFTNKAVAVTGGSRGIGLAVPQELMNSLIKILIKFGILREDLDYHLVRASMVRIWFFLPHQSTC